MKPAVIERTGLDLDEAGPQLPRRHTHLPKADTENTTTPISPSSSAQVTFLGIPRLHPLSLLYPGPQDRQQGSWPLPQLQDDSQ